MREQTLSLLDICVYQFIVKYKSEHCGNSPAIRDIMDHTNNSSTSMISRSMSRLAKLGYLRLDPGKTRNITVTGSTWIMPISTKQPHPGEEL